MECLLSLFSTLRVKIFLVVAQVFKKPHIAKNEDCAKEITDLKPGDTSTGMRSNFEIVYSV